MIKKACLAILLIFLFSSYSQAAERRMIEAEEFDGLARYPYHNHDAEGWYARESNCRRLGAPGKGYHAQIHAGSAILTAQKKISPPLPPGKYKVFIRVSGHMWHDTKNAVRIGLGKSTLDFEWQDMTRFEWLDGKVITLTTDAQNISLEAIRFGGKGFKHLYDTNDRTLVVDSIYITSDLNEKSGPTGENAAMMELGRELPVEMSAGKTTSPHRQVKQAETPEPENKIDVIPIVLKSFDQRKNMWPNSSFEIGGGDGWSSENHPYYAHIFDERDHVKGEAVHGDYSRRIPAVSKGMSRPVLLPDGGTYTLSVFLRGEIAKPVDISLIRIIKGKDDRPIFQDRKKVFKVLNIRTNIPSEWKRVHASARFDPGFYILKVESEVECFIDAVQFEPGGKPTAYSPRANLEAGLATSVMGNILYDDQPTKLIVWINNSSDKDIDSDFFFTITDVRENPIANKRIKVTASAGSTTSREIVVGDPPLRGLFSSYYSSNDRMFPEGELIFCVLPSVPNRMPRHALGCHMDNLPEVHALMARMGHKWQLYCKLKSDWPKNITPKPNQFNWEKADKVLNLAGQNGLLTLPALWPTFAPPYIQDPGLSSPQAVGNGTRDVVRKISTKKIPAMPDLDKWGNYCENLGRQLGATAFLWVIEDETEMYYSPREFNKIIQATMDGFRKSGAAIKTYLSCTPEFTEEMIEDNNGNIPFDVLGGSTYNFDYLEAVKVRGLQRQTRLPWYSMGVGQDRQPQMNHAYPGYQPVYASSARTAREMVLLCLAQDARMLGHYTGRLWSRGGLYNTDFPLMALDGSPLPHGFSFSCIPLLLADAVPLEDVYIPSLDILVFIYEQEGRLGAITWANNSPNHDIHWKNWPRKINGFQLDGNVEIKDMYGNPHPKISTLENGVKFELTEEPVFIINKGMSKEKFIDMFRNPGIDPPRLDMRLAFVSDGKQGVDLGVFVRNNTGHKLNNLKIDADFPSNRMVTRTSWMLPDRIGKIGDIAEGETVLGRINTVIGLDYPVENATFSVWLTDGDQESPWYERCWMTVAPPRSAIQIDGVVDDWQGVQPAWIYNTFSWSRFGRSLPHIVSGAENLKYINRIDARVAIYAGYDDQYLFLALDCRDNHPSFEGALEKRDHFTIRLKPDFLNSFEMDDLKSLDIEVVPEDEKVRITGAENVLSAYKTTPQGFAVELAIPMTLISNGQPEPGQAIGFDIIWSDADYKGIDQGVCVLRWAGGSRSLGQLFLGK